MIDHSGETYGKLLVKHSDAHKNNYWICKCACGAQKSIYISNLKSGAIISCGCHIRAWSSQNMKKNKPALRHGMSSSGQFYTAWVNMRQRCENPKNSDFHLYGERGIKVCTRWSTFENFYSDMFASWCEHIKIYPADTSIDRIDVNGYYCKDNCRWATARMQRINQRPRGRALQL